MDPCNRVVRFRSNCNPRAIAETSPGRPRATRAAEGDEALDEARGPAGRRRRRGGLLPPREPAALAGSAAAAERRWRVSPVRASPPAWLCSQRLSRHHPHVSLGARASTRGLRIGRTEVTQERACGAGAGAGNPLVRLVRLPFGPWDRVERAEDLSSGRLLVLRSGRAPPLFFEYEDLVRLRSSGG